MLRNCLILFLFFISNVIHAQSGAIETAEIKTTIWCDHCQECADCGVNIFTNVKKVKGVKDVTVDDANHLILVKYRPDKVSIEEIENAIALTGFDANDLKADADAYMRLDACCKKPE